MGSRERRLWRQRGEVAGKLLQQCWRRDPSPLAGDVDLDAALTVFGWGAAGLAWRHLRFGPACAQSGPGRRFEEEYVFQAARGAASARQVRDLFADKALIEAGGITAKGWSASRWYATPALRPYSDVDIYVAPGHRRRRPTVPRAGSGGAPIEIDWQQGCRDLADTPWEDLADRSQVVVSEGTGVRVFSREDELRLDCLHFLRHGGRNPVWLCDIAAILEGAPGLDWDLVLRGSVQRSQWIAAVLQLAGDLLGADAARLPGRLPVRVPGWFRDSVLEAWGRDDYSLLKSRPDPLLGILSRRPKEVGAALALRWRDPLEATVRHEWRLDRGGRRGRQGLDYVLQAATWPRRLAGGQG